MKIKALAGITELGNKTREVLDIKEGVDIDEDNV